MICPPYEDNCGNPLRHPDCSDACTTNNGLGSGLKYVVETKYLNLNPDRPLPEVWLFVQGYEPKKLDGFASGESYSLSFDYRKTIVSHKTVFGFFFPVTEEEKQQDMRGGWLFSNTSYCTITDENGILTIWFDYAPGSPTPNPFAEVTEVQDPNEPCFGIPTGFGICLYPCCPADCTKPYDNNVFCLENHQTAPIDNFSDQAFEKQSYLASQSGIIPVNGIALTRSGDAYNENGQLLYSSQKWVMVWDFEINRLMDVFPAEWMKYGAAFYYQNQTLRKEIKNCSNRKPYYIEVVDLGLTNTPQGSFNLDLDGSGQRTTNWDVPSRLLTLHRNGQQLPPKAFGTAKPTSDRMLHAEFNHVSMDAFKKIIDEVPEAQRTKFVSDRELFVNNTTSQRYHDQIMFLAKETAEKTLRCMNDMAENGKHLSDMFNPEAENSFGYFVTVLLSAISKKMLRTKNEVSIPFSDFKLEPEEETSGDWLRYIYGEIRRLVEISKIDKKDFQTTIFEAMANIDPTNPNSFIQQLKSRIDTSLIKQQYDMAANARINPGNGVNDPDTKEENKYRGL